MSREIKFRAWSKHFRRYMDRVYYESASVMCDRSIDLDTHEWWGTSVERSPDVSTTGFFAQKTGDVIVEQYTGLKDKNGKEIHEGDIISVTQGYKPDTWEERGIVVWDDEYARFDAGECIADGGWEAIFPNWRGEIDGIKVIGNIHENPELLGGEE